MMTWQKLLFQFRKVLAPANPKSHDFSRLKESEHMLLRIYDKPYEAIVEEAENLLSTRYPNCEILNFNVSTAPDWLTSLRKEDSEGKSQVSRIAVAFEFSLKARFNGAEHLEMKGVFTWLLADLGLESRRYQFRIDPNGELTEFGSKGEMLSRLYAL